MDASQLLAEALRLSDEERAALGGELIQSLETDGTGTTSPWSEARRRIHAAAGRVPRD